MSIGNTYPSSPFCFAHHHVADTQCLHASDVSCMSEFRGEGFFLRCGFPIRWTPNSWLVAAHFFRDPFSSHFASFWFGWVIFTDDYSNTGIVGAPCTLREVRAMVRMFCEKLSFIMDCTGSPNAKTVCATSAECHR